MDCYAKTTRGERYSDFKVKVPVKHGALWSNLYFQDQLFLKRRKQVKINKVTPVTPCEIYFQ